MAHLNFSASAFAVAVSVGLVTLSSVLPLYAADSKATTPAAVPNKQLAAIEIPIHKDASTAPGLSAPMAATMAPVAPATQPATVAAPTSVNAGDAEAAADLNAPKLLLKKGQPLILTSEQEDVQPTDDVNLAKEQAQHFPDSAEAAFILAVALTRTSRVEEALQEVRVARRLAQAQGGPAYFDKMIKSYEDMLETVEDPRVRYSLAWAYYMKAYLLAQDSRRALGNPALAKAAAAQASAPQASAPPTAAAQAAAAQASAPPTAAAQIAAVVPPVAAVAATVAPTAAAPAPTVTATVAPIPQNTSVPNTVSAKAEKKKVDPNVAIALLSGLNPEIAAKMALPGGKVTASQLPVIPTAIQKAAPTAVPQIHQYYAAALKNLDAVLAKKPDDVWALLYRWHLYAEDTGNLAESMKQWREAEHRFPSNPGVQFFLGEGYLKEGNLKEAVAHASKAIFLRALGN